jgi:hypothetical protein
MSDDPFFNLSKNLLRDDAPKPAILDQPQASKNRAQMIFEASLRAVQETLSHLSIENIEHPPHAWFDAILARQIAVHVAIKELGLARSQYAANYHRTAKSVRVAIDTVDDRNLSPEFADTYAVIAKRAAELNTGMEVSHGR